MLRKKYQSLSPSIVSYDWIDTATGNGYITFYLQETHNGSAYEYNLVSKAVPSHTTEEGLITAKPVFTSSGFKFPGLIKGDIFCGGFCYSTDGGNLEITIELTSGSTTTTIGAKKAIDVGEDLNTPWAVKFSITGQQVKVGDVLKVTMGNSTAAQELFIGTSPLGAASAHTLSSTITYIMIPFQVDV